MADKKEKSSAAESAAEQNAEVQNTEAPKTHAQILADRKNPDNYKLQEEVANKYTCTTYPGPVVFNGQGYDLRKISLATADKLVKEGFDFLVLKTAEDK